MLVLDILDVVTLNESNSQENKKKKLSVSNLLSHFLPQVRGYNLRHTQRKNPTVYIFPGIVFGVASRERCVDYFRFFDDSNIKQMLEVTTATKQGSAKTKGNKWDRKQVKTLIWKWVLSPSAVL